MRRHGGASFRHWHVRMALAAVAAGVAAQLLLAPASSGRGATATPDPAQVARGRTLFLANCSTCHGQAGQGTNRGPTLIGVGAAAADYWLSTGRMPLQQPQRDPPRNPPAFGRPDIDALVAYVASLGPGPAIPTVDPARGNLPDGQRLFQLNCAACHSATGVGYTLQSGRSAPSLLVATPTQVGEAVRIGPGTMPEFGADVVDDRQLDSIARYVLTLQQPSDRGGATLGRVGPVAEALVGWIVGLGVLIVVIWRLGERARAPRPRGHADSTPEAPDG